jgi:hypothetical protein
VRSDFRHLLFGWSLLWLAWPSPSQAYSYESAITVGCHERIAVTALKNVRTTFPSARARSAGRNEQALIDDLPYELDADVRDLVGSALTIGVRDNDLKGRGPIELDQLAQIHGNPSLQPEHCLRSPELDGEEGSRIAVERCREFIRQRVRAALDGLDANGTPDPAKRVALEVTLALRGRISVDLPAYWIEIGRALHALEDSFSHTFRSPDHRRIRVVLNYSEYAEKNLSETRDGPAHRAELDECEELDGYRKERLAAATEATIALLRATLDPSLATPDQKLVAVETTLDEWLTFEPGCTFENRWCEAPERRYAVAPGCSLGGSNGAGLVAIAMILWGAVVLLVARRRARSAAVASAIVLVTPSRALSQEPPPPPDAGTKVTPETALDQPPSEAPSGTLTKKEVTAEQRQQEHESRFGVYAAASGSVSNESLNGQLGGRLRLSERWMVGLDGEINGWFAFNSRSLRAGAFNGYATLIFRTPLRFADFNLRSTANAGFSTLLIDLYGAPSGSTGLFVGLTPLGLEWKVSSALFLVIDAIGVAVPIPHLTGAPFAYPQYRAAIGLELSL